MVSWRVPYNLLATAVLPCSVCCLVSRLLQVQHAYKFTLRVRVWLFLLYVVHVQLRNVWKIAINYGVRESAVKKQMDFFTVLAEESNFRY